MSIDSTIILTNQDVMSYNGDKFRGDGYYGYNDGLNTVSIQVTNFIGRIYVQASIVEEPTSTDWFDIDLTLTTPYLEYANQTTETKGVTFTGNFVWLRGVVDRSYQTNQTYSASTHGRLEKISLLI
jgi:hypothetical protein